MKKSQNIRKILLCVLISGLMTFTLSYNTAAQDSEKSSSKKKVVVLKIKKEDNGKTTVIDTTFNIATSTGQKEFEKFMAKNELELEHFSNEPENIEVLVDMADFPDSLSKDSIVKQFRIIGKDGRSLHYGWEDKSDGYEYDFDIEGSPDFDFSPFQGYRDFEDNFHPGLDMEVLRNHPNSPTLSDILGDIPMAQVKSYSVKDRKNGKRIIIDIEDAPLLVNENKVIIIREPGKQSHKRAHPDRQKKVIMIKSGDSNQMEELEVPPPPPPPPPKK
jgi:hypothetical protein